MSRNLDKKADLTGSGIGNYIELEKILPGDYQSSLDPRETQQALYVVKTYIEENLSRELNLMMVQVPLIVDATSLKKQLEISGLLDYLKYPYHQAIINNEIPLSIGDGIGQSRTQMLLLRKAHLGEVSVSV